MSPKNGLTFIHLKDKMFFSATAVAGIIQNSNHIQLLIFQFID